MAAWATTADVSALTGRTVTGPEINMAQSMVEGLIKRVYRDTDANTSAYYWLNKAVAWQAVYIHDHPEVITAIGNIASLSQDGFSVSYRSDSDVANVTYSPVALSFLNNLYRGANTTIRLNSAFQKDRLSQRRAEWRRI